MPIQRCNRNGEQGWQYGDSGKCYTASEEGSDEKAKQQAYIQGYAIEDGNPLYEEQHMSELDVPIIKKGIFNRTDKNPGLEIIDLQRLIEDTKKAMPFLIEAQQMGQYRGKKNARFNTEVIPPFIHIKHYPNNAIIEKFREWTSNVKMEPDIRLFNAEEWGFVKFTDVDPDLAKLLAEGFPNRSGEFLPNFENPDTGEIYPIVLRSVAFLGANTEPAVPQQPGYSVKLAQNELGVQMVSCEMPNINQSHKESEIMPKEQEGKITKLSLEDIQRFEAMENRFTTLEHENKVLKEVVNELKVSLDSSDKQVIKLQVESKTNKIEAFCLKLEKDYHLTPAALEAVRLVMSAENGVVKMSEEAEPIPVEKAYMLSLESILTLAKDKDALFIPKQIDLPKGKQQEKKVSALEKHEAQIIKLQAEAKEKGKELSYADARMQIISTSNSILEKIAQMTDDGEDE